MIAEQRALVAAPARAREWPDLLELVFYLSAFIALFNTSIVRAFTTYDAVIFVLAFLIVAGPVRMQWIPRSLRVAGLVLVLAGLLSAFRSTYPVEAITQVLQYAFVFFVQLPVILTLAKSRRAIHGALLMFILSYLVIVALTMLNQIERGGRVLAFHTDENANVLGLPAVFLSPLILYFAFDHWRRGHYLRVAVGGAVSLYLILWALTASGSRGAAAATIVSIGIFVPFRHGFQLRGKVFLNIAAVAVAVVSVGGFVYWTELPSPTLKKRIEAALSGPEEDAVVDERVALDRAGLRAFLESPLIGTGFDNFSYVSQTYDDSATAHAPHNVFIQFLAQAGILGALAFCFVLTRWFIMLLRTQSITVSQGHRELMWAFVAAMAGIITHAIAAPLVLQRHYWLLYGLGIVTAAQITGGSEWLETGRDRSSHS